MKPKRILRHKLGKRWWTLAVLSTAEMQGYFGAPELQYSDDIDIALVLEPSLEVIECAIESSCKSEKWPSAFVPDIGRLGIHGSLHGTSLLCAPERLLRRFLAFFDIDLDECLLGADSGASGEPNPRRQAPQVLDLPDDPTELPRFREEGVFDPFGQNPELLTAAWNTIAHAVCQVAKRAEQLGRTMSKGSPGQDCLRDGSAHAADSICSGLELMRSYLVASMADDESLPANAYEVADVIASLGYLLLSGTLEFDIMQSRMRYFFHTGRGVAMLHEANILHGDIHPGNFLWDGIDSLICDVGSINFLQRPLSTLERARDLAVLKPHCDFEQWEAVKLGYRLLAPEPARAVFRLL